MLCFALKNLLTNNQSYLNLTNIALSICYRTYIERLVFTAKVFQFNKHIKKYNEISHFFKLFSEKYLFFHVMFMLKKRQSLQMFSHTRSSIIQLLQLKLLIKFLPFQLCIVLIKTTKPYPLVIRDEQEKSFLNTNEGMRISFPSIDEPFSVLLSVIVPAFDEEVRCKFSFCYILQPKFLFEPLQLLFCKAILIRH